MNPEPFRGQKLIKDGKTLEPAEANLVELMSHATEFLDEQLPILKALQID